MWSNNENNWVYVFFKLKKIKSEVVFPIASDIKKKKR